MIKKPKLKMIGEILDALQTGMWKTKKRNDCCYLQLEIIPLHRNKNSLGYSTRAWITRISNKTHYGFTLNLLDYTKLMLLMAPEIITSEVQYKIYDLPEEVVSMVDGIIMAKKMTGELKMMED